MVMGDHQQIGVIEAPACFEAERGLDSLWGVSGSLSLCREVLMY